jgi:hypothetical protein
MNSHPTDKELLERLLRGELSEADCEGLRLLLADDSEEGDEFFAGLSGEDDEALILGLLARRVQTEGPLKLSAEARARLQDQVVGQMEAPRPQYGHGPTGRQLRYLAAVTLVAIVGSALLIAYSLNPDLFGAAGPITKGPKVDFQGDPQVFIQFAAVVNPGDTSHEYETMRGVNLGVYPDTAWLAFRYRIEAPSAIYIARVDPKGNTEIIYPANGKAAPIEEAGIYDANKDDQIFLDPLKGPDGIRTYCAVSFLNEKGTPEKAIQKVKSVIKRNKRNESANRIRYQDMDCFKIKVEGICLEQSPEQDK